MLTEVRVQNQDRADLPELSMSFGGRQEFDIVFIDGLTPVKAVISTVPYANSPGDFVQNSRVGARNIVLTLDLNPNFALNGDAEDSRATLYQYFIPTTTVRLDFVTDKRTRTISGIVETFEGQLFARNVKVQISVICPNPYFTSGDPKYWGATLADSSTISFFNSGDVPMGIRFKFHRPSGSALSTEFTMKLDSAKPKTFSSSYPSGFLTGSHVMINSKHGEKDALYNSSQSMLPYLARGYKWPVLEPGPNGLSAKFSNLTGNIEMEAGGQERYVGL